MRRLIDWLMVMVVSLTESLLVVLLSLPKCLVHLGLDRSWCDKMELVALVTLKCWMIQLVLSFTRRSLMFICVMCYIKIKLTLITSIKSAYIGFLYVVGITDARFLYIFEIIGSGIGRM